MTLEHGSKEETFCPTPNTILLLVTTRLSKSKNIYGCFSSHKEGNNINKYSRSGFVIPGKNMKIKRGGFFPLIVLRSSWLMLLEKIVFLHERKRLDGSLYSRSLRESTKKESRKKLRPTNWRRKNYKKIKIPGRHKISQIWSKCDY